MIGKWSSGGSGSPAKLISAPPSMTCTPIHHYGFAMLMSPEYYAHSCIRDGVWYTRLVPLCVPAWPAREINKSICCGQHQHHSLLYLQKPHIQEDKKNPNSRLGDVLLLLTKLSIFFKDTRCCEHFKVLFLKLKLMK